MIILYLGLLGLSAFVVGVAALGWWPRSWRKGNAPECDAGGGSVVSPEIGSRVDHLKTIPNCATMVHAIGDHLGLQ